MREQSLLQDFNTWKTTPVLGEERLLVHFLYFAIAFHRFVERTDQVDYVDIIPGGGGCYAQLPYRTGGGRLEIGLQQSGCIYVKIVVHELLHSLGFMHEQNRPDRNTYITVNWANIQNGGGADQFFMDWWDDGTTPSLPACDSSGQPAGKVLRM